MPSTITWYPVDRGHYTARLHDKHLEIRRNADGADSRRYLAFVDGRLWPTPCWTLNEAKTRAIRWAQGEIALPASAGATDIPTQALVPYQPPANDIPAITFSFRIAGTLTVADLSAGLAHLSSAVELLRELGEVECDADLPPSIKL